jgi:hypothetical protein
MDDEQRPITRRCGIATVKLQIIGNEIIVVPSCKPQPELRHASPIDVAEV